MKLFTNGCSWTHGAEILNEETNFVPGEKVTLDHITFLNENIWSGLLHKKLNTEKVYNLSSGAGSNARIVRTTLDFFIKILLEHKEIKDYIAVIQWTDPSRFEVYDNLLKEYISITNTSCFPEVDKYKKKQLSSFRFTQDQQAFKNEWLTHLVSLSSFFKCYGIKYLFCTIDFIHNEKDYSNYSTLYQLPNNFYKKNIIWLGHDEIENQILNSVHHRYPCKHPNLTGHNIIAERLYFRLKELYNI